MKMKRVLSLVLCFVMMLSLGMVNTVSVSAAEQPIKVKVRNYMADFGHTWTKEKYVKFSDVQPVIINDRVMVPIRAVAEELGYEVLWNDEYKLVQLAKYLTRTESGDAKANQYVRFINMMYNLEAGKKVTNFYQGSFVVEGYGKYAGKKVSVGAIHTYGGVTPEPAIGALLYIDSTYGVSYFENQGCGKAHATYVMDTPPIIRNGRTLIPLRAAAEMLGLDVSWDGNTRTVTISA